MTFRKFSKNRGLYEDILKRMEDDKVNLWRLQFNKLNQNHLSYNDPTVL